MTRLVFGSERSSFVGTHPTEKAPPRRVGTRQSDQGWRSHSFVKSSCGNVMLHLDEPKSSLQTLMTHCYVRNGVVEVLTIARVSGDVASFGAALAAATAAWPQALAAEANLKALRLKLAIEERL